MRILKRYVGIFSALMMVASLIMQPLSTNATSVETIEPGFASEISDNLSAINNQSYTGLTATYDVTKTYRHMLMTTGLIEYISLAEGEGNPGFDHTNLKAQYTQNGDMLDLTFETLNYGAWGVDCLYINLAPTQAGIQGEANSVVTGSLYFEKISGGNTYRSKPIPFIFTLTNQTPAQPEEPQQPSEVSETIEPGFASEISDSLSAINNQSYTGLTFSYDVTKTYRHMLMTTGLIEYISLAEGEGNPGFDHTDLKVQYTQNGDMLDLTFEKLNYGAWGVDCLYIKLVPTQAGIQGEANSVVTGSLYFEKISGGITYRSKSIPFTFTLTNQTPAQPEEPQQPSEVSEIIEPGFAHDMSDNLSAINGGTFTGLTATYDVKKTYRHMLMTTGLIEYINLAEGEGNPGFDHTDLKVQYTQNGDMLDLTFEKLNYGAWGVDCLYIKLVPTQAGIQGEANSVVTGSLYFEKISGGITYRSKPIPFAFTLTNQTSSQPVEPQPPLEVSEIIEPGFAHDMSGNLSAINEGKFTGLTATYDVRKTYRHMLMTTGLIEYIGLAEGEGTPGFDYTDLHMKITENGELLDISLTVAKYDAWDVDCIYLNIIPTDAAKQLKSSSKVKGAFYFAKDNYKSVEIPFEFLLKVDDSGNGGGNGNGNDDKNDSPNTGMNTIGLINCIIVVTISVSGIIFGNKRTRRERG